LHQRGFVDVVHVARLIHFDIYAASLLRT